ncbi:MAG: hypothetical protein A3K67_05225 [Euryarchaeota archaeon RBG_16_62_10]|nr:MAG: hypothetical protein A3K67_05225 [Euryarchaeota archaeon RBG_16_62_10]
MESEWRKAIERFVLNNLGQMEQEEVDAWLEDELDIAPFLEPVLKSMAQHRDMILRELHQISPSEIFDRFQAEHPELDFHDNDKAVVRVGKELQAMKVFLLSA